MDQSLSNPVGVHFVFESGHGKVMLKHFMVRHKVWHEQRSWALLFFIFSVVCLSSPAIVHSSLDSLSGSLLPYIVQESRDICKTQSGNGYWGWVKWLSVYKVHLDASGHWIIQWYPISWSFWLPFPLLHGVMWGLSIRKRPAASQIQISTALENGSPVNQTRRCEGWEFRYDDIFE